MEEEEIEKLNQEKIPREFGGWLILVGIGLHIQPFMILSHILENTKLLPTLKAALSTLCILEIIFSAILVITSIFLLHLFWRKKKLFKTVWIYFMVTSLLFHAILSFLSSHILNPLFTPENAKAISEVYTMGVVGDMVFLAVWGTYTLKSKRVEETFIN